MPKELLVMHSAETDEDRQIPIRRADWTHIRVSLSKIHDIRPSLSIAYSVCFAIAAAAGASIFPVSAARDLPAWVTPLYVCISISSVIIGGVLVWLDRRFGGEIRNRVRELENDLREIEQIADNGPLG
jgi:hypothetical protein